SVTSRIAMAGCTFTSSSVIPVMTASFAGVLRRRVVGEGCGHDLVIGYSLVGWQNATQDHDFLCLGQPALVDNGAGCPDRHPRAAISAHDCDVFVKAKSRKEGGDRLGDIFVARSRNPGLGLSNRVCPLLRCRSIFLQPAAFGKKHGVIGSADLF